MIFLYARSFCRCWRILLIRLYPNQSPDGMRKQRYHFLGETYGRSPSAVEYSEGHAYDRGTTVVLRCFLYQESQFAVKVAAHEGVIGHATVIGTPSASSALSSSSLLSLSSTSSSALLSSSSSLSSSLPVSYDMQNGWMLSYYSTSREGLRRLSSFCW